MLNIYKASAGSGKTFTLTRQYLTLLLGFHDKDKDVWRMYEKPRKAHRHILAITFTNKATNEMVERIIKELALLGGLRSATEI
ncbi:MAG: UvrD-helicase domain-containing protein, partial [Muribaculaceae bacterium]|nr:UvrD-helicase domain-containing protein [Muribaculaceae bacterium]